MAAWPSGKARVCKILIPGSNPGAASNPVSGTLSLVFQLIALCILLFTRQADALEAGAAKADIMPSGSVYIAGYGQNRMSEGAWDTLYARCLYLKEGKEEALIVALDLVGLFWEDVEAARGYLKKEGFAPERVMVASTHTHSGPDTLGLWGPSEGVPGRNKDYQDRLFKRIVDCAKAARTAAAPAQMGLSRGEIQGICHNVRKGDKERQDHKALIVRFRSLKDNKELGLLVNYGCHPESMNTKKLSADIAGLMAEELGGRFGAPVVFLNGILGGMITPVGTDGTYGSSKKKASEWTAQLTEIAKGAVWQRTTLLEVRRRAFSLPVENARFVMASAIGVIPRPMRTRAARTELMLLRMGNLSLLTVPGEPLPAFGLQMKNLLKTPYAGIIGLGNDEIGYIIPEEDFDEKRYEESMSLGPRTATLLYEQAKELVK